MVKKGSVLKVVKWKQSKGRGWLGEEFGRKERGEWITGK